MRSGSIVYIKCLPRMPDGTTRRYLFVASDSTTPVLALKERRKKRPGLFVKRVDDQTGMDSQVSSLTPMMECVREIRAVYNFEVLSNRPALRRHRVWPG